MTLARIALLALAAGLLIAPPAPAETYPIVDTGQTACYDATGVIAPPGAGEPFCGQDAQHAGNPPEYTVAADGLTVADQVTGLVWQRSPDTDLDGVLEPQDKLSWWDALDHPATLNAVAHGGYDDWRLPTIKELYSLILFSGVDPSGWEGGTDGLVPFLDTDAFAFIYGDESQGERIIDSQYWTATEYVGTTMNGAHTVFGVNFADGRIKGYGTSLMGEDKTAFVLCVRGNPDYGVNALVDNGDGTVTDTATGLMWQQDDSGEGLIWEDALAHAAALDLAGHDDWRLPTAKELQSIVDYARSPATHGTAAIDPVFGCTAITDESGEPDFGFYWTATTHANWSAHPGAFAVYVCFGSALGWMQAPFPPFEWALLDVHGAGAQRSDPKVGDPDAYPHGHGPQGDVVRIANLVRCVRDADPATAIGPDAVPTTAAVSVAAAPNPFNPRTTLRCFLPRAGDVRVDVYDARGRLVASPWRGRVGAGETVLTWDGKHRDGRVLPSGVYLVRVHGPGGQAVARVTLAR